MKGGRGFLKPPTGAPPLVIEGNRIPYVCVHHVYICVYINTHCKRIHIYGVYLSEISFNIHLNIVGPEAVQRDC